MNDPEGQGSGGAFGKDDEAAKRRGQGVQEKLAVNGFGPRRNGVKSGEGPEGRGQGPEPGGEEDRKISGRKKARWPTWRRRLAGTVISLQASPPLYLSVRGSSTDNRPATASRKGIIAVRRRPGRRLGKMELAIALCFNIRPDEAIVSRTISMIPTL